MRCLVVGGTGFLGGAIVDALAAEGHAVSILSRGGTARDVPAGVEAIRGDRHEDLSALADREFDWAFDTCAYAPDAVEHLLDALGPELRRYVLISSISAYGDFSKPGLTEAEPVPDATDADIAVAADIASEDRASAPAYGASYGPLKRACERAADARSGERATALRVGLLVGAGDYTDRLTWWVRRLDEAKGSRRRVPAPGPETRPVQMIDVRDVAGFALRCANDDLGGIWNVTGRPIPFSRLLDGIVAATGSAAEIVWVRGEAVTAAGIAPWTEMPLMAPTDPAFRHFLEVDTGRAEQAGLITRPLAETLEPLVAWDRDRRDSDLRCGMTEAQEAELVGD